MSDFIMKKKNDPIPVLIIDMISYCNYSCIMCPQKDINRNEDFRGVMDFELYTQIIDELATPPQKARVIIPFWNGEPVLYPQFREALDYAAEKKREFPDAWEVWSLHSNFSLIDEKTAETIIGSELFGPITVSLDAYSSSVYNRIRVGGNRDEVYRNIEQFLTMRNDMKKTFPTLTIQFIAMDENMDEAEQFIEYWKNIFAGYNIEPDIIYDEAGGMERDCIFIRRMMSNTPQKQSHYDRLHR
ncbi:MAG: radical SAM protein, partial [Candidatus Muiribacteriaceae bacterium]